jgi:hypothetical protein
MKNLNKRRQLISAHRLYTGQPAKLTTTDGIYDSRTIAVSRGKPVYSTARACAPRSMQQDAVCLPTCGKMWSGSQTVSRYRNVCSVAQVWNKNRFKWNSWPPAAPFKQHFKAQVTSIPHPFHYGDSVQGVPQSLFRFQSLSDWQQNDLRRSDFTWIFASKHITNGMEKRLSWESDSH